MSDNESLQSEASALEGDLQARLIEALTPQPRERDALVSGFCDGCGVVLNVGPSWYHKSGTRDDLCKKHFGELPEEEQRWYTRVDDAQKLAADRTFYTTDDTPQEAFDKPNAALLEKDASHDSDEFNLEKDRASPSDSMAELAGNDELQKPDSGDEFFLDVDGGDVDAAESRELIGIPDGIAEALLGSEALLLVEAVPGASLALVSTAGRCRQSVSLSGSAAGIDAARRLLLNQISEALQDAHKEMEKTRKRELAARMPTKQLTLGHPGSKSAEGEGLCKWFAAGFCKFGATGRCRNGIHDGAAGAAAESAWLAEGPGVGSVRAAARPVLVLFDLEGGGKPHGRFGEDEIIELPALAMCPVTGSELGRFHSFVRPGFWDLNRPLMRQQFRAACFNPESSALPFAAAIEGLLRHICAVLGKTRGKLSQDDFLLVTCGDWDVKTALPRQWQKPAVEAVPLPVRLLFSKWCNIKEVFRLHFGGAQPNGMRTMLNRLEIPLQGQHHLGMDDVSNLAKILRLLVVKGAKIAATGCSSLSTGEGTHNAGTEEGSAQRTDGGGPTPQPKKMPRLSDTLAEPVEVPMRAPPVFRSASSILAKYSSISRAQAAGQNVRVKRDRDKGRGKGNRW